MRMISLKQYLDAPAAAAATRNASTDEPAGSIRRYRSLLSVLGRSAAQDGSPHGRELEASLKGIDRRMAEVSFPELSSEAATEVETHVNKWGSNLAEDANAKADELRELLIALAKTAESVQSRDQSYTSQFTSVADKLKNVCGYDDLAQIRSSLVKHVSDLKSGVDKMAQESREVVTRLKAEVHVYEARLKAVEDLASRDELTKLPNRRKMQQQINASIKQKNTFCVVIFDLNNFKLLNDRYGHNAGDDLLKQFSSELKSGMRGYDEVGRWGGDEFIAVMLCVEQEALSYIERLKSWTLGKYTLTEASGHPGAEIQLDAAIGIAQWQDGETLQQVVERADADMYKNKPAPRSPAQPAAADSGPRQDDRTEARPSECSPTLPQP
jgi:diguanylate cyclase (GGDEF)-like protein